jgi:glyoxylase-like metal-dependent hydrolase (beta-lactamase superfamily II)
MRQLREDVWVAPVAPGLWVHSTTRRQDDGSYLAATGMLMETKNGSVLFDTGWNIKQTEALLSWAQRDLHKPVSKAVITHWHKDKMGGIPLLVKRHIPVFANERSLPIAKKEKDPLPQVVSNLSKAPLRDASGYELFYPGPGHTSDNIVAYFPQQKVLYGGCFVKSTDASTMGYIKEASLSEWPTSVKRVQKTYPHIKIAVPGHGTIKGDGLQHTLTMLKKANAKR